MLKFKLIFYLFLFMPLMSCDAQEKHSIKKNQKQTQMTEEEWKDKLTPEQYRILREKGTEYPNTGEYNLHFETGNYHCAGCDALLFESSQKFESSCGWPSFDDAIKGAIEFKLDKSHFMVRTEIICKSCGGHLGHIFDDGPTQTGQRYCVNSVSLVFKKKNE